MPVTSLAPQLMTLAGIAYGQPGNIPAYLQDTALATGGLWQPIWLGANEDVPVNYAYIVKNSETGAYCIAIRGTYPNPLSPAYWDGAKQDNPFGAFQDWPYPVPNGGAQVSAGTWAGFNGVIALVGDHGQTFAQAVAALPPGATLYVTGHSLGGTLAPVIAQWATTLPNQFDVQAVSFAGMTPGNMAFAALISGRTQRYYNDLDSVPYGWSQVLQTKDFYQPAPQGGDLYRIAIDGMAAILATYGYATVGTPHCLKGTLFTPIDCPFLAFIVENLRQHLPDTYLQLLGAPALPFKIGFGAMVTPTDHPVAGQAAVHDFPVQFL